MNPESLLWIVAGPTTLADSEAEPSARSLAKTKATPTATSAAAQCRKGLPIPR